MKLQLEITLDQNLTAEEIAAFRAKCESQEVAPETKLAELIRQDITTETKAA